MEDSPVKELNKMEASNLLNIKFKRIVIRMLKELKTTTRNLVGTTTV